MNKWVFDYSQPRKKYLCPSCGRKTLVKFRWVDSKIGELCEDEYGKCDRSDNCGFTLVPPQKDKLTNDYKIEQHQPFLKKYEETMKEKIYIPNNLVVSSASLYKETAIYKFLINEFPDKNQRITEVMEMYLIGKSKFIDGANVFWFIDSNGNCHYGQIKSFDSKGKTVKDENGKHIINSVTSLIDEEKFKWVKDYKEQSRKIDCFFGSHLFSRNESKDVGIVEAPATCLIMAILYPEMTWMATGAAGYLKYHKLGNAIHANNIALLPDYDNELRTFNEWNEFSKDHGFKCLKWWDNSEYSPRNGDDYKDMVMELRSNYTNYIPELDVWENKFGYPVLWDS